MKRIIFFSFALTLILSMFGCTDKNDVTNTPPAVDTEYTAIKEINHCAVEPDDKLHMSDSDELYYETLMNAMLNREPQVTLSENNEKNEYYIDLLRQSPYFYFLNDYTLSDNVVEFSYAYSKSEQDDMLMFIDSCFLDIVNTNCSEDDNTLDKIMNIYGAVARYMTYDHDRTDNKQLDSSLFKYPHDEIYKALKNEKSVCYGFAYTLRFALLQYDIDCFCVYGPCHNQGEGHMWNIFKYGDSFFTCDSAWDRADNGYARLYHFGKTDKEREADSLNRIDFSSEFFGEYGEVECTNDMFKIFRGIERYTYVNPHTYYCVDFEENEYIFDTETFKMK